jgi:Hypothetical protein (DUF2513)
VLARHRMKRNWDTIREILGRLEETGAEDGPLQLSAFPKERAAEISYHMELLLEAGLVKGNMIRVLDPGPTNFFVTRLTWQGHEWLAAVRSDTVWQKAKKSFVSSGISMTFDLVKSVATDIAAASIEAALNG